MRWTKLDIPPINGTLNNHTFVANEQGQLVLRRTAKDNPRVIEEIRKEYKGVGFLQQGGDFQIRTPLEQYKFTLEAAQQGLRVLPPLALESNVLYYPHIKGKQLETVLAENSLRSSVALKQLFCDLRQAHIQNVVYGDRWLPNILFSSTGIIHIDFDIAISGQYIKEFEVSQVIYYTLISGKSRTSAWLKSFLKEDGIWFTFPIVNQFLQGHIRYFKDTQYADNENYVKEFIVSFV